MKKLLGISVLLLAVALPAVSQAVRLSLSDQQRFDSYYSRWQQYKATNNASQIVSMEKRMQDVYSHYGIPPNTPYGRVSSSGGGAWTGGGAPAAGTYRNPNWNQNHPSYNDPNWRREHQAEWQREHERDWQREHDAAWHREHDHDLHREHDAAWHREHDHDWEKHHDNGLHRGWDKHDHDDHDHRDHDHDHDHHR
jgi:hypothetical protein